MIKECTTCGNDFVPSEAAIRKRTWKCKDCRKIRSKIDMERRKANGLNVSGTQMSPEYHSEYQKSYNKRDYVKKKKIDSFYKSIQTEEGMKKHRCRIKTRSMIKSGALIKSNCENCNSPENIEAHHEDYSRPDLVIWLCKKCHANLHSEKARGGHV